MTTLLVQTDTAPTITGTISLTSDGTPVDLDGCTVYFQMRLLNERRFRVDAEADIVVANDGTVSYDLDSDDLRTAGSYLARWLVVFGDGRRQHTSPAQSITVEQQ